LTAVAAYLRVYEPLEAFSADERSWWRAVAAAAPLSGAQMAAREHAAAVRAMTALPPRVVSDLDLTDGAARPVGIVLQPQAADGRLRVCPIEMTWRSLLALEDFQTDVVPSVLPAFLPATVIEAASTALAQLVSERSSLTGPHVRSSRWSVPLGWFAVFQPSHRHAEAATQPTAPASGHPSGHDDPESDAERTHGRQPASSPPPAPVPSAAQVSERYLAPMADARRCLARALASVRVAETSLLPLADLEEIGRWLEEFHARSVVELDYSGLGPVLGSGGAAVDESVADIAAALADLRTGSVDEAVTRLAVIRDRWDEIRAHEHAS
jgi:hypothetical protein